MSYRNLLKKAAAVAMSLAMAFTTATFLPVDSSVVYAAPSSVKVSSSSINLNNKSDIIATYTVGPNDRFYIVIANNTGQSDSVTVDADNIDLKSTSEYGVYYTLKYPDQNDNAQYIRLENTNITSVGTYRIYYMNEATNYQVYSETFTVVDNSNSSSSSSSSSSVSGPQISKKKFTSYAYGMEATFKVSNDTVDYEWHIYDKTPSSGSKTEIDGGTGGTSEKNEEINIVSTNLEKNTKYYFTLKVTGDKTRRTTYFSDKGTSSSSSSYYMFKTKNDESSPNSSSTSSGTGTNSTTKKNSDGSTTTTTTARDGSVTTKTEETVYTDNAKKVVITQTGASDGSSYTSETNLDAFGAGTIVTKTTASDGSYIQSDCKVASSGAKTYLNYSVNNVGDVTAITNMQVDSDGSEALTMEYTVEEDSATLKKIKNGSKTTITVPDTVEANGSEFNVETVAANAFKGDTTVKKLVLSDSVTEVGKNAFKGNKKLKTIVINSPLDTVGTNAFKDIYASAVIKIDASASAYKKTVTRIKKAGVGKKVKFKNI